MTSVGRDDVVPGLRAAIETNHGMQQSVRRARKSMIVPFPLSPKTRSTTKMARLAATLEPPRT